MGSSDELPSQFGTGNRESGSDIRLEYYDRTHEDKSLPFFGRDEVINEILRTTPHLSASLEEIKDYYERNPDNKDRTEYVKSIFNNDYTELTLEDGRTVGYKTLKTFCICGRANTTVELHRAFMIGLLLPVILKLCDYWEN